MKVATDYKPGDSVYRYAWVGGETYEVQPLTIVRVNRLTVTVRTFNGSEFRMPFEDIEGRWKG